MILILKYEGMLSHSFDRFYVVTKFILPTINNLKSFPIDFDETCGYLQEKNGYNKDAKEYIFDLRIYCKKIIPFVHYYRQQISSFNQTVHNILRNKISLILPILPKDRKGKRGIIILLITGFYRFGI